MSKRLRNLCALVFIAAAIGVYLWLFGIQTFFIWETRSVARKAPIVWVRPVQLTDASVSKASGKRLSYHAPSCNTRRMGKHKLAQVSGFRDQETEIGNSKIHT
jgi:hypothetical protein